MGPTASGKTDLAVNLVERMPCDIISVDSALVYKEMDVGTAKPDAELLARAPHRLINLIEPEENYSVARFKTEALHEIQNIHSAGRIPLLVGGTMMYFNALFNGLATLPDADKTIRTELEAEMATHGLHYLHQQLSLLDPAAAIRIHPNDSQRVQRALEVWRITGKTISQHHLDARQQAPRYQFIKIAVAPTQRQILHDRIKQRFQLMLKNGFVEELERLRERPGLTKDMPSMRCVGYRQLWGYLDSEYDYQTMVEKGIAATRQLAKRQLTWLRGMESVHWFDLEQSSDGIYELLDKL